LRQPIEGGAFPQSVFSKRVAEHYIFIKTAGMTLAWEELMRPSRIRELIKTHRYDAARGKQCQLCYTEKKENQIFLIYKEIQMGTVENFIYD
jgi:hypothetical protein